MSLVWLGLGFVAGVLCELLRRTDTDRYAAYANHCAIRKVLALTSHSWKRAHKPKVPKFSP